MRNPPQGFIDSQARHEINELKNRIQDLTTPESKTPEKLMILYHALVFHPRIKAASQSLFETTHYAEAIFEAFKTIEIIVKEKSTKSGIQGRRLMTDVFDERNPLLKLNDLRTDSDKDEQEGFKFLFMGAMIGIRNPKAHASIRQNDPIRALQYLSFADLLAHRTEEATVMNV